MECCSNKLHFKCFTMAIQNNMRACPYCKRCYVLTTQHNYLQNRFKVGSFYFHVVASGDHRGEIRTVQILAKNSAKRYHVMSCNHNPQITYTVDEGELCVDFKDAEDRSQAARNAVVVDLSEDGAA